MQNFRPLAKKPIYIIPIFIVVIIAASLFINRQSATIKFDIIPADSSITIDGVSYQNKTTEKFKPGVYEITISHDDLETKQISIELQRNSTTNLNYYLTGENNNFSYYESNYDGLYSLREYLTNNVEDNDVRNFLRQYDKKREIKNILPISTSFDSNGDFYYIFFEEGTSSPCSRLYCLTIGSGTKDYAKNALQAIRDAGFNPDDYQIFYKYDRK